MACSPPAGAKQHTLTTGSYPADGNKRLSTGMLALAGASKPDQAASEQKLTTSNYPVQQQRKLTTGSYDLAECDTPDESGRDTTDGSVRTASSRGGGSDLSTANYPVRARGKPVLTTGKHQVKKTPALTTGNYAVPVPSAKQEKKKPALTTSNYQVPEQKPALTTSNYAVPAKKPSLSTSNYEVQKPALTTSNYAVQKPEGVAGGGADEPLLLGRHPGDAQANKIGGGGGDGQGGGATATQTALNMMNELEGSGLLGIPYAIALGGGYPAVACMCAVGAMAGASLPAAPSQLILLLLS